MDVAERRFVVGGAANVAANARGMGAVVKLAGVTGVDDSAAVLRAELKKMEIGIEFPPSKGLDQRIAYLRRVVREIDDAHVHTRSVQRVNVSPCRLSVTRSVKDIGIIKQVD